MEIPVNISTRLKMVLHYVLRCHLFPLHKAEFSASLLINYIVLICYFAVQETCLLIINVGHSCAAQLFRGHEQKHDINMRGVWAALTEEFVGPAVERLARTQVFVFLVILHRTKVSQSPHEAPKVHLILTEIHETERETQKDFKLMLWFTLVVDRYVLISTGPDQLPDA